MKTLTRVVFRADQRTKDGYIYPESTLRAAVEKAQEKVRVRAMFGNADGKWPIELCDITHVVTELRMEAGAMVATIEFLDTPKGKAMQEALEAVYDDGSLMAAHTTFLATGRGSPTQAGVVEVYELESLTPVMAPSPAEIRERYEWMEGLFERQHKRVEEAGTRWREETKQFDTRPDLGELVQWLLDGRDAVERENAELKQALKDAQHYAVETMKEHPPGSEHSKAYSALFARIYNNQRTPSALYEENLKLKAAIRHHASQSLDDRCWLDDQRLYEVAGVDNLDFDSALPPKEEFLANCARFHECRQNPAHTKYTTVEEKIKAAVAPWREALSIYFYECAELKVQLQHGRGSSALVKAAKAARALFEPKETK